MAEFSGSALYVQWIWSSGTIALSGDFTNFTYAPTVRLLDATAGADPAQSYLVDRTDGQVTITAKHQAGSIAFATALTEGRIGTLVVGVEGSAAAKMKWTIPAISLGGQYTVPYNDVVTVSATFQQNGSRTDGTF